MTKKTLKIHATPLVYSYRKLLLQIRTCLKNIYLWFEAKITTPQHEWEIIFS